MIDSVYFANMEQESESEWWGPPLFGNGEWEIDSHGEVGMSLPFPRLTILPSPKIENVHFVLFYN